MLTLITYPANFGQSSASPFCIKAEYLLNMSKQPWTREDSNDPRKAPRRKFPVLRTPDGLVHDSDDIRIYLENQGAAFDVGLTSEQQAIGHGLRRIAEEHLYFVLLLDRWERDDVWPLVREEYFGEIPGLVRNLIAGGLRKTLLKGMDAQGLGRLTWDERMQRAEQDLQAISTQLKSGPFLFGDTPCSIDASVAPILGAIRATPVPTPLSDRVASDAQLCAYIDETQKAMGTT